MSESKTPQCNCHEKYPTWPVFRANYHVDGCPYLEIDQLRARVAELEAALRPFAEWYKTYTEENIAAHAVLAYRRAAELLK